MLVLRELILGVAFGIATSVVFEGVQMAGQILSVQMGYSLVNILDPTTQVDTTVVAMFQNSIAMLIFLRLDVHLWLLRALGNSFYLSARGNHASYGAVHHVAGWIRSRHFADRGADRSAVLSATLLTDIVLALMGKSSPQLPIMLLGPAVKSLLGIAILYSSLKYWPNMFRNLFLESMGYADRLLHLAR